MKIDGHQHFWTYSPQEYGWINSEAGTYAGVVEVVSAFVGKLPHHDQVAFWGETAQRVYGLG